MRIPLAVETIRLGLEPLLAQQLAGLVRREVTNKSVGGNRSRELLAEGLFLSEEIAPRLHALLREAQRKLGLQGQVRLYQVRGMPGEFNASAGIDSDPPLIELRGSTIACLADAELLALFGHELGHLLAHGRASPLALRPSELCTYEFCGPASEEDTLLSWMTAFFHCCELTADRFALLTCQDLHTAVRMEIISLSGGAVDQLGYDLDAYLEQCRELMLETLEQGGKALGSTHPEHNLRTYASWLFHGSDTYRALTGKGPGSISLQRVDDILRRLVLGPEAALHPSGESKAPATEELAASVLALESAASCAPSTAKEQRKESSFSPPEVVGLPEKDPFVKPRERRPIQKSPPPPTTRAKGFLQRIVNEFPASLAAEQFLDRARHLLDPGRTQPPVVQSEPQSDPHAMDLEAEIRRLESEQRQARGDPDDSCDDLERRFRELEDRERNR